MEVTLYKKYNESCRNLYQKGGKFQKAAEKANQIIGSIQTFGVSALQKYKTTNHGETRIKNCVKYDLTGFCRLITVVNNNLITILYVGSHDNCDKFLNTNKGLIIGVKSDKSEFLKVYKSDDERKIETKSDWSTGKLIERLSDRKIDTIYQNLVRSTMKKLDDLESTFQDDDLIAVLENVADKEQQDVLFDVFLSLKAGHIEEANNRIDLFTNDIISVDDIEIEESIDKIESNDTFIKLNDFEQEDLTALMQAKDWMGWMLFMHPDQRKVVEEDFNSAAKLMGVSGSGKTCVIVKRAIRLAREYKDESNPILIVTINRSLAKLIESLIAKQISKGDKKSNVLDRIQVKSFWKVCKDLLNEFEPYNNKLYEDYTAKQLESESEIWEEFYTCKENNDDAKVLLKVHSSLLSRGIDAKAYIKEEFDWIRSTFFPEERNEYLTIERIGRKIPLLKEYRSDILKGLNKWEDKMEFVGVSDYLNLIKPLSKHIAKIKNQYRAILIDELQDFGTTELDIIKRLVPEDKNYLFLCGDIAQKVYTKNHNLRNAGISIAPSSYRYIKKNYRNSREILIAASSIFNKNISLEDFNNDEFQILEPEYANFSSPKPFLRKANSLKEEFNYALEYLNQELEENEKGIIAICGYDYYDITFISEKFELKVLNGKTDLTNNNIFISDLEQTKGFEFDRVVIINCSDNVFPNTNKPKGEYFRDFAKLYVAMTRAKKELVISYSGNYSRIFSDSLEYFSQTEWSDYVQYKDVLKELPEPSSQFYSRQYLNMTGSEFIYTNKAIGMTNQLQEKLVALVDGSFLTENSNPLSWKNMGTLLKDVTSGRHNPQLNRLFGSAVYPELKARLQVYMPTRLIKLAKELNIGTKTIVDAINVNLEIEVKNKPTAIVPAEAVKFLYDEFGSIPAANNM